jgi:hypothetical protein
MEIIESLAWIGLGFIPTLVILELVSRKGIVKLGTRTVSVKAGLKPEVLA